MASLWEQGRTVHLGHGQFRVEAISYESSDHLRTSCQGHDLTEGYVLHKYSQTDCSLAVIPSFVIRGDQHYRLHSQPLGGLHHFGHCMVSVPS